MKEYRITELGGSIIVSPGDKVILDASEILEKIEEPAVLNWRQVKGCKLHRIMIMGLEASFIAPGLDRQEELVFSLQSEYLVKDLEPEEIGQVTVYIKLVFTELEAEEALVEPEEVISPEDVGEAGVNLDEPLSQDELDELIAGDEPDDSDHEQPFINGENEDDRPRKVEQKEAVSLGSWFWKNPPIFIGVITIIIMIFFAFFAKQGG